MAPKAFELEQCRRLIEDAPGIMAFFDAQGQVQLGSAAYRRLSEDAKDALARAARRAFASEKPELMDLRSGRPAGGWQWYRCQLALSPDAHSVFAVGVDKTEPRREIEQLRRGNSLLVDAQEVA